MGARAQIRVESKYCGPVFLYTHYGSGDILKSAQDGMITGKPRWKDTEYLTRILFDSLKAPEWDNPVTGYGIGVEMHGDIDCYVSIDCETRMVSYHKYQNETPEKEWSFDDFITEDFN